MDMQSSERVYLDWAAAAIPDYDSGGAPFGNPSSKHAEGRKARETLEEARSRCAALLGVQEKQICFTSGGTESNALVIHSLILRGSLKDAPVLASTVEHPSVGENIAVLRRLGFRTGSIEVEKDGRITTASLERALKKYPAGRFAAIMAVNNETGAVMDIPSLTSLIRSGRGAPVHVHCDMVQGAGKIPFKLSSWDVDSASISAHKLGGPRGIGLLYLKRPLEPVYTGGGQEGGLRPGTENTAGAVQLAACLERRLSSVTEAYAAAALRWRGLIRELKAMDRCTLIPEDRLEEDRRFSPYILQAAFRGIPGEVMVRALDDAGIAVSTGSACSSSSAERRALAAMGVDETTAREGIRISQGWTTGGEDIERLVDALRSILQTL
jgi:cysteine desulfurase